MTSTVSQNFRKFWQSNFWKLRTRKLRQFFVVLFRSFFPEPNFCWHSLKCSFRSDLKHSPFGGPKILTDFPPRIQRRHLIMNNAETMQNNKSWHFTTNKTFSAFFFSEELEFWEEKKNEIRTRKQRDYEIPSHFYERASFFEKREQ